MEFIPGRENRRAPWRRYYGNSLGGGLNARGVAKCDFRHIECYISETVQDRR